METTAPQAPRRRPGLSPTMVDAAIAVAVAVVTIVTIEVASEQDSRPPDAVAYALGAAVGAVLLARRRWPFGVLVASGVLIGLYHVLNYPGVPLAIPLAAALYSAAVAGRLRAAVGFCLVVVVWSIAARRALEGEPLPRLLGGDAVWEASFMAAVLLLGDAVRSRRALAAEMRERLRQAEAEQQREAQRRVVDERLRITRELHDVTSHTIAVIAVQAGVAQDVLEDADTYPDAARAALETIRAASKQAMAELRATVGMLRDGLADPSPDPGPGAAPGELDRPGAAPRRPAPGLGQLGELLEATAGSGLRIERRVEGEERPLPAVVDLTAYRIVQEALTNVLRHAAATTATVVLRHQPDALVVEVTDDGRGAGAPGRPGGYGLAGMAERAAALGGRVEAGPRPDGGFRVRAWLPLAVPAAEAGAGAGAGAGGPA